MLDFEAIRTAIVSGLHAHLSIPVVMRDQGAPQPGYPYVGLKDITPLVTEPGLPAEVGSAVPSTDPRWDYDYQYEQRSQPTMVWSVTVYSQDAAEAQRLALESLAWFAFHGYENLKDAGIVVAPGGEVGNRDTLVVDDYERRRGFDVRLRVASAIRRTVPTIETVEISREER